MTPKEKAALCRSRSWQRNWQIAAGGVLLLALILASGMVWFISRSHDIPCVVKVDKLGYALTEAYVDPGRDRANAAL